MSKVDVTPSGYLNSIDDPIRQHDARGNPFLAYTGQHVVNAFKAGHHAGMEAAAVIAAQDQYDGAEIAAAIRAQIGADNG